MQGLTKRQAQTLDYIRQSIEERGYPPTLREIGEFMGIRSTNGVNDHLRALERKGYLRREDMKSRALRLVHDKMPEGAYEQGAFENLAQESSTYGNGAAEGTALKNTAFKSAASKSGESGHPASNGQHAAQGMLPVNDVGPATSGAYLDRRGGSLADARGSMLGAATLPGMASSADTTVEVHVLGRVAAGLPLLAEENVIDTVRVDPSLVRQARGSVSPVFGLRVQGDSMIEAGIFSGDYIFVRQQATADRGQIVVALIGEEATVKYYYPERDYIRFQPANASMAPILVRATDFKPTMLLGVVVGLYRRI